MTLTELVVELLAPVLDPLSRTWWGALAGSGAVAVAVVVHRGESFDRRALLQRLTGSSTRLDVQLLASRQLVRALLGAGRVSLAWLGATHAVRWLDGHIAAPSIEAPTWAVHVAFAATLFVVWDASRWLVHWALHRSDALWRFHQVHHSATALTPLTFHRVHPVESALYQARGVVATGTVTAAFYWLFRLDTAAMWGVPLAGMVLNTLVGNLRHSHVWLPYPAWLERWLISPAQHQLHHAPDTLDHNLGTWLSIWDRMAGRLLISTTPPERFGLAPGERNHHDTLLSAWFGPLMRASGLLVLFALPSLAWAQDEGPQEQEQEQEREQDDPETEDGEPPESFGMTMFVTDDGPTRIAGAASEVDQATLEQFEYDDVERVLAFTVPGVSTRGEDGYGLRPNIGIRGASSDRSAKITLLEDGVLLAPAPYAAPAAYYFPMSTRMVGLEVFKGAAATRHGPNTVGGAINLRTRPIPDGLDYGLDLAGGRYATGKAHGFVGVGGDRAGVLAEAVVLGTQGFKHIDGGGPTGFIRGEAMLKGQWRPATGHTLQLKAGWAQSDDHETYLGLTHADLQADPYRRYAASSLGHMVWQRSQLEASWLAEPSSHLRVRTVAYHHWLDRSWTKFAEFADGPDPYTLLQTDPSTGQGAIYMAILRGEEDSSAPGEDLIIGTNERTFHSFGVQSTLGWEVYGDRVSSELEAGLRIHGDVVDRVRLEAPYAMTDGALVSNGDSSTTLDSRATAFALAAHVHEDLSWGELHVIPGLRAEVIRTYRADVGETPLDAQMRAILLPGAGALYSVTPWLQVFGGAYRGFSPVAPGQPVEVQPESSWNYELGTRLDQGDTRFEVVGFFNDYTNLSGQCSFSGGCDGDQVDRQFNGGSVHIYGVEASAGAVLYLPGAYTLPVDATYTWTESRFQAGFQSDFPQFGDVQTGDSLPYVARHQGNARVSLRHPRYVLGVGVSARGAMLDEAGTYPVDPITDVPALLLVDANASVFVTERVQLYATGTNLTGSTAVTSWRPVGARPTAPLQVMLGVKVAPPAALGPPGHR